MKNIKTFEMLNLFALLFGSVLDDHSPKPTPHLPLSQILQDYLKVLDFIYAPLQAHQGGLDLKDYIDILEKKAQDFMFSYPDRMF
ncbi:hypothetical protein [Helicobacter sp. L8]|uniref:hypothetical protein n=1 Tax=Helicobacter sp. L8 TaxID=2316078 RepID=UPI000EB084D5|nr:hypothetical protein [Helicobacter sp. L8]